MQLSNRNKGRIGATLCLVTANLFSTTGLVQAQEVQNAFDEPATSGPGNIIMDGAVMYYRENNSRIQAIEPMASYTDYADNGDIFSIKLTADSLSGASPFGATPWIAPQNFLSPTSVTISGDDGSTGASGGVVVTDPVTQMKILQTTAKANELPLNPGFQDTRGAANLSYTKALASRTRVTFNLNGSIERDYQSYSGGASIAQDFNNKTTTISVGVNYQHDLSKRLYGTPTPFAVMTGVFTDGTKSENIVSATAGITQVITRNWLVQLNYSYERATGYQNNPYKVISVLDPVTGAPQRYLYEARPDKRTRNAVYIGSKLAVGSFVTNLSARYYHDSWGINSITANASEHIPIGTRGYIEPGVRYYHQSSADFFNYFLLSNAALPQFASADNRLDKFNAITASIKGGYMLNDQIELYAMADYYRQTKAGTKGLLPGNNGSLNLFAGVKAISVMTGVKYRF